MTTLIKRITVMMIKMLMMMMLVTGERVCCNWESSRVLAVTVTRIVLSLCCGVSCINSSIWLSVSETPAADSLSFHNIVLLSLHPLSSTQQHHSSQQHSGSSFISRSLSSQAFKDTLKVLKIMLTGCWSAEETVQVYIGATGDGTHLWSDRSHETDLQHFYLWSQDKIDFRMWTW